MDERFGSLKFEGANKKLKDIQKWLVETRDLGYDKLLIESDINIIKGYTTDLKKHLQWLLTFDIASNITNVKQEHDTFENTVNKHYNNVYQTLVMRLLPFLREERRRENPNERKLDEEVRQAAQLRVELEKELKTVRADIEQIKSIKQDVGVARGQRAAVRLAAHFDEETRGYQKSAKRWFWAVVGGYTLVVVVLGVFASFALMSVNELIATPSLTINKGVLWGAGIAKLVIAAALWYGLSFIIKNYNVSSHLAAVNRHRAAVARTLEDFIAVEQQQEKPRLSEMLRNATDAMFKHAPIGFVSKTEKENSQPILQIVNDLMGIRNPQ
jgi:GGDEF domain-containing protein